MNSKYFFFGIPGRYALVDSFSRAIWLLSDDLEVLLEVREIFSFSKLNVIAFDLQSFDNYQPGLLDNSVCLDWQIPVVSNIRLVETSIISNMFTHVHEENAGQLLINQRADSRLSVERQQDLQQQMMLAHHFVTLFNKIPLPNYKRGILQQLRTKSDHSLDNAVIKQFKQICKTELTVADIEEKLFEMATNNLKTDQDLRVSSLILQQLDKLYA